MFIYWQGYSHFKVHCWLPLLTGVQCSWGDLFLLCPSFFKRAFFALKVKVAQSCPTLHNPMDYTVHGLLHARILEWVAFSFSRGSCQPRDRTQVSCIAGGFFTSWGAGIAILRWWGSKMLYLGHRGRGCVSSRWRGISVTICPSIFAESLVFYCCRPNYH